MKHFHFIAVNLEAVLLLISSCSIYLDAQVTCPRKTHPFKTGVLS